MQDQDSNQPSFFSKRDLRQLREVVTFGVFMGMVQFAAASLAVGLAIGLLFALFYPLAY